jgi:hypothetical protein
MTVETQENTSEMVEMVAVNVSLMGRTGNGSGGRSPSIGYSEPVARDFSGSLAPGGGVRKSTVGVGEQSYTGRPEREMTTLANSNNRVRGRRADW